MSGKNKYYLQMLSLTWIQGVLDNEADFLEKINILNSALAVKRKQADLASSYLESQTQHGEVLHGFQCH